MRHIRAVLALALVLVVVAPQEAGAHAVDAGRDRANAHDVAVANADVSRTVASHRPHAAPRAYCSPLRAALRSSRTAVFLTGPRRQRLLLLTEYRYHRAALLARKAPVARAMSAASGAYRALRGPDMTAAGLASQRRFAAVPPAAHIVRRDCRVDLRRPVDYVIRISMATSDGGEGFARG